MTIPNSVYHIGDYAFRGCSGLKTVISEIENPTNVIDLDAHVFWDVNAELIVPKGTKSLYQTAFGWKDLKNITEAAGEEEVSEFSVNGIYYKVGENNTVSVTSGEVKYSGDIVIPEQVTYNGWAYKVVSIGNYAFSRCSGLTSISIPNSVAYIGIEAFYECSSLISVTIPNSVISIGDAAFSGCSGLTTIVSEIEKPSSISYAFSPETYSFAELIVPKGTKTLYEATEGWKEFKKITEVTDKDEVSEFSVNGIYYKVGENNTVYVTSGEVKYSGDIVIPEQVTYNDKTYSVTNIGTGAFAECSYLTSVIIPNSVASIGICAFYGCSNLTSVVIPNSVNTIWYDAFHGCSALSSVSIPNSVTSIGEGTFYYCI